MTDAKPNELNPNEADATRLAGYRRLVAGLPVTMRPSFNQQLAGWETLFPYEQNRLTQFSRGLESFPPAALEALTAPLRALETKMGVERWNFSQAGDTMENASQLARSEFYAEWRSQVQRVFAAIDAAARQAAPPQAKPGRMVLIVLPESLPVPPLAAWKPWDARGKEYKIDGDGRRLCELLLQGRDGQPGIAALLGRQGSGEASELWLVDAEARLGSLLSAPAAASCLDYATLKPFRDRFLAEVNTVPKNIQASDETLAAVRRQDWERWWPAGLAGQGRLRAFVINLFLSGNGALIFSNAFVEWAASEALRRARPRVLVARFGLRAKPKPFTGIAIFENQQRISALPDVDDPEGSAIDALILARYIWLAAARYPEQEQTCCLCVSEHRNSVYLIAPPQKAPAWSAAAAVTPEEICAWAAAALAEMPAGG